MAKQKVIKGEDFRRMQLLQLDMLVELDRVCRENGISYQIGYGTLLGAIRHKGYIPWDDDADILMLREEYEKFKKCINQLDASVCYFQDHDTDSEYRWGYGKLKRTGTKYVRLGQEHMKCNNGVFIDIFPLDDVPDSIVGQLLQDFHCYCLRKIMWSEVGKYEKRGPLRIWYKLLSYIPVEWVFKQVSIYAFRSKNNSPNKVRTLTFPSMGKMYYKHSFRERYGAPKEWFINSSVFSFEGHKFYGSKYYDEYLTFVYGNYMELPPEDKRQQHSPVSDYSF